MQKILITGARAPIALELARSFSSPRNEVIMADSLRFTISRWSNSVSKYYVLPAPRYNIDDFIIAIQEIIQTEQITHFIPTCEEAIYVAFHKEKFDCKVWTCESQLIIDLHNKYRFHQIMNPYLPIPKTVLVNNFLDWKNSKEYVFKRIYSRFATNTIIGKAVSKDYLKKDDRVNWIAQDYIKGKEICIYSLWNDGILKAYSAYHPLYQAGKGSGIFFQPIKNNRVLELVKNFGKQINYTGQLCFDVIIDKEENPYFIECNPRGTSGAHLINEDLAACFLENKQVIINNKNTFSIKYVLAIFHPFAFFKKQVRQSKDVIYQRADKKPFFLQIISVFEMLYIKFTKNITLLQATTDDIEWNDDEN